MQKLRIAILSYRSAKYGGGQGVYVRDISFALSLLGHDVDVISGPPYPNLHDNVNLINEQIDIYRSISREEIQSVAQKYVSPNQRVEIEYLPGEEIGEE